MSTLAFLATLLLKTRISHNLHSSKKLPTRWSVHSKYKLRRKLLICFEKGGIHGKHFQKSYFYPSLRKCKHASIFSEDHSCNNFSQEKLGSCNEIIFFSVPNINSLYEELTIKNSYQKVKELSMSNWSRWKDADDNKLYSDVNNQLQHDPPPTSKLQQTKTKNWKTLNLTTELKNV